MTKRHNRIHYYLANKGTICGEVERPATPSEEARAFRFSRIVETGTPAASDALLEALAGKMTEAAPDTDGPIPAGFTYLGQFVDHDLTRDRTQVGFGGSVPVEDLVQARSPALDLDSVYGEGPGAASSAAFYQADGVRLKLGTTKSSGPPATPVATLDLDGFDLPRKGAAGPVEEARQALIADPRNDENLAVAQTHLAFLRFHNKVCDRLAVAGTPSTVLFERARETVVKHYQWMLRFDFLPRIVDPAIVTDVFSVGRRFFEVGATGFPTMPVEFSVAAYRLGHSMIRDKYDWNAVFAPGGAIGDFGTLDNLFRFSGTSGNLSPFSSADPNQPSDLNNPLDGEFERLPTNWVSDWTRMFDFANEGVPALAPEPGHAVNMARPIDIRLTDPLKLLPLGSFGARGGGVGVPAAQRNLAFRNLVRGRMVRLATAQEVVKAMQNAGIAITPLTSAQILGSEFTGLPQALQDELVTATPLWFYVLREAGLNGGKMGSIGGRIVAEVFHRAIEGSRISILRDPFFTPTLGRVANMFRMTDLLGIAFDAAAGEMRPLSQNAPRPTAAQMKASIDP
ncbi:peroxidase family protein [Neoroseomonas rubea]|uniref:peroxidase family protein n=1 Tax=Neoroseomonas rubea TaxID=2748666 RepID=UPI0018DFE928|nr:heme peroxidase family protein [Roseomonas rubea]